MCKGILLHDNGSVTQGTLYVACTSSVLDFACSSVRFPHSVELVYCVSPIVGL
jgi:hypothetical protein